jgi:hypothetical protein
LKPWVLESGLLLVRQLADVLEPFGYGVGLCGSVLHQGRSRKDLDVIVFPHRTDKADKNMVLRILSDVGLKLISDVDVVRAAWKKLHNSDDQKEVRVYEYKDQRIDIFFLQ